ncbi:Cap64p [Pleurotus pulmonarius]
MLLRRAAHIRPPRSPPLTMGSEEKPRLAQRSLGVTNRIWLIVGLIIVVLTLTHFILPSTSSQNAPVQKILKSKNYLNASQNDPNPFPFCPLYGPGDDIGNKYGALALSQSRMHLGSGARIQRVLQRALSGQPVTISVIGGSISACHGAGDDPISPKCYPTLFFNWWNSIFPHPATELTNGAVRRTNSHYFGYCHAQHIPDVTDLVIIELDTDDTPDRESMEHFEVLVRSILLRPDQPAVVLLGHFSPQVQVQYGFAGPDHWHDVVAQYYDVPHISTKPALYPSYLASPGSISKFYADAVLASPAGHQVLADVLSAYIQSQVCAAWDIAMGLAFDSSSADGVFDAAVGAEGGVGSPNANGNGGGLFGGLGQRKGVPEPENPNKKAGEEEVDPSDPDARTKPSLPLGNAALRVPQLRIISPPPGEGSRPFEEISPFCVSANDLVNPLPPSLFFGSGWFVHHPSTGDTNIANAASHYYYSTLPTSKIRIPLQVGAGDIGIYYVREKAGKQGFGEGSAVECWVDDNYAGAKTLENAGESDGLVLEMIDHYVSRGSHFVECQLLGEEGEGVPPFKIVGVFTT